jgi:hypothetical protein
MQQRAHTTWKVPREKFYIQIHQQTTNFMIPVYSSLKLGPPTIAPQTVNLLYSLPLQAALQPEFLYGKSIVGAAGNQLVFMQEEKKVLVYFDSFSFNFRLKLLKKPLIKSATRKHEGNTKATCGR